MSYLTPADIEPTREAVRQIRPDEGIAMTWDQVEAFVLPAENERWEHIKSLTAVPWDAIRKLKGFL